MIQDGSTVSVHYTGKLKDGEIFDSSIGKSPLTFVVGSGQIIDGFERAIIGKNIGEKVTVEINPVDGYGEINEDLVVEIPNTQLPGPVEIGQTLEAQSDDGNVVFVQVKEVHEEYTLIDGNHPLAGKDIVFDIEIVDIN